jgi:hypothetical protein
MGLEFVLEMMELVSVQVMMELEFLELVSVQ